MLGQQVITIVKRELGPGAYAVNLDGSALAPGL